MALALLWLEEGGNEAYELGFDIGHNHYYGWHLGGRNTVNDGGLSRLAEVHEHSALVGPLPARLRGRGRFRLPTQAVTRDVRYVQLLSYRDCDGNGPAISAIVTLPPPGASVLGELPPPAYFDRSLLPDPPSEVMTMSLARTTAHRPPVDAAPLRWRERSPHSEAMFIGAILGGLSAALPAILPVLKSVGPMVAPAIGGITTGAAPAPGQLASGVLRNIGGGGSAAPSPEHLLKLLESIIRSSSGPTQTVLTPQIAQQIVGLINQAAGSAAPAAKALDFGSLGQRLVPHAPRSHARSRGPSALRLRAVPRSRPQALGYSEAMSPLLAALPALMPLLQQVLTPQTVQSLIDAPQKMTGQVISGITDFAKLGIQAHEKELEHLRALNPGVNDPALDQLIASMSMGLSSSGPAQYRRVPGVRLDFDGAEAQMLFGRSRVLYRRGQALQFPLRVATPKRIAKVHLALEIKHADTLKVLWQDEQSLGEVGGGPLPVTPRIEADAVGRLASGVDYIVVATLRWRNKRGTRLGTSMQQRISLVGEYAFDRVEETGEPIALADFERDRDYWHKIWEYDFSPETRRVALKARYYFVLSPKRTNNARLDTRVTSEDDGPRSLARLRAGMELSLYALNHLMSRLAPDASPLGESELEALSGEDFVERFNQAGAYQALFKGRPRERAALWAYPEFKLQTLVLAHAADVDANGQVSRLAERRVRFPVPVMMHFVGVKHP